MSILKWYAGGQDRAEQAISILTELVADLNHSQQKMPLQQVLSDYIEAFSKEGISCSVHSEPHESRHFQRSEKQPDCVNCFRVG